MPFVLTTLTGNVSSIFRQLRLWNDAGPTIVPPKVKQLPSLPAITYDKGLPGLPDDIICEIFSLLDTQGLKSCSLTGKALSCSAKPFLHRTLQLTHRDRSFVPKEPSLTGGWGEFRGLSILGERELLQHVHHISISLPRNPLFPHDLQPHIQHFRTLKNLQSLKTRWLDIPSFISRMEEFFGAFSESLQSLDLEFPRGDHKQILYFVCQFPNLRDLRIKGVQDHTHAVRNGGPHFDIETSPPLSGTLDLQLNTENDKGAQFVFSSILTLPSGLKFRNLKLSGCTGNKPQLLVDACAPALECMDFTGHWFSRSFLHRQEHSRLIIQPSADDQCPQLDFKRNPAFRKLEIKVSEWAKTELVAAWLTKTLSTVTSSTFTELTICITRVSPSFDNASEDQVYGWNSVDNVLDRLSLCEDVALVLKPQQWIMEDKFKELIEKYFPLMWENGRVVLEEPPPLIGGAHTEGGLIRRMRVTNPGRVF